MQRMRLKMRLQLLKILISTPLYSGMFPFSKGSHKKEKVCFILLLSFSFTEFYHELHILIFEQMLFCTINFYNCEARF